MDRDIRLSPKAIRLTDERDAPSAKRSGWVRAKPKLRSSRKVRARSFRKVKVARVRADIKDMYVDTGGRDMVTFLEVLDGMLKRGVELRLIHMRRSRIRPRRMRWVARRSVATEPRSGRKRSRERKRNFENGVLTDNPALVEPLVEQFDSVWRNAPAAKPSGSPTSTMRPPRSGRDG